MSNNCTGGKAKVKDKDTEGFLYTLLFLDQATS